MHWLFWIALAVIVAAFAAVTGVKPRHTRPVAHTGLMSVARVALFVMLVIVAYALFHRP